MSADGSNITRITYTGGYYRLLGIDVTRRYIVVTKKDRDTGKKSLWLIDLRKGEEKRLTDPENNAEGDSFSPDGKWIVFEKPVKGNEENAGAGVWHIFKIRSDGTDLIDLRGRDIQEWRSIYLPFQLMESLFFSVQDMILR